MSLSLRSLVLTFVASSALFATGCINQVTTDDGEGGSGGSTTSTGSSGAVCGGIAGLTCENDSEYCEYGDTMCGAADQMGVCTPKPAECNMVTDNFEPPVCGCDGVSYPSECAAHLAGTSVAHEGTCETPEPKVCGGFGGDTGPFGCDPGEFCEYPDEAICGAADAPGHCSPIPEGCTKEFAPVCGCDQITYGNRCTANLHGVSVLHEGSCDSSNQPCGFAGDVDCPESEFCNYEPGQFCGGNDSLGSCTQKPFGCTDNYAPVCGCDWQTYSNECEAHAAGQGVYDVGECPIFTE